MKTTLGYSESRLVDHILSRVYNVMKFDSDMDEYVDIGDFVLSLDLNEMKLLLEILKDKI